MSHTLFIRILITKYLGEVSLLGKYDVILPSIPIILDNVKCGGHETSLLDCSYNDYNDHDCVDYEDVVLECKGI